MPKASILCRVASGCYRILLFKNVIADGDATLGSDFFVLISVKPDPACRAARGCIRV